MFPETKLHLTWGESNWHWWTECCCWNDGLVINTWCTVIKWTLGSVIKHHSAESLARLTTEARLTWCRWPATIQQTKFEQSTRVRHFHASDKRCQVILKAFLKIFILGISSGNTSSGKKRNSHSQLATFITPCAWQFNKGEKMIVRVIPQLVRCVLWHHQTRPQCIAKKQQPVDVPLWCATC